MRKMLVSGLPVPAVATVAPARLSTFLADEEARVVPRLRRGRSDWWRLVPAGGHAVSLVVAAAVLLRVNQRQWFRDDEWVFFNNRMQGGGRVLFEAHNEHWSTVPILIYRGLFAVAGLRSYLPYVAVLVVLHLVAAHLLWRVLLRSGVAPLLATALTAVFAVFGAGAQNLLWAFQIGFVASVALGLGHLLLVDHEGSFGAGDVAGWLVALVGLMCSGVTVTMVLVAGLAVLLKRGPRDALATVSLPGAVYLVWLQLIGKEGLSSHTRTLDSALDIPTYVWTGLSAALERGLGIPEAGATLVVLVMAWMLYRRGAANGGETMATAMALGAACLFVIVGAGRSAFGPEQAAASRYVYIAFALLLPVVGLMLTDAGGRSAGPQVAVLGIVALVMVHNVSELRRAGISESEVELRAQRQIVAAARLLSSGAAVVSDKPEPAHAPDLTAATLARFTRDGKLPDNVLTDERDALAAVTNLQVALLEDAGPGGAHPATIEGTADLAVTPSSPSCWMLTPSGPAPRVELRYEAPGAIALRLGAGGDIEVALRSAVDSGLIGEPRRFALAAGATRHLVIARPDGSAILWLPPGGGDAQLCGAGLPA